jgi:hypothetical protein
MAGGATLNGAKDHASAVRLEERSRQRCRCRSLQSLTAYFCLIEPGYARLAAWPGQALDKARLRPAQADFYTLSNFSDRVQAEFALLAAGSELTFTDLEYVGVHGVLDIRQFAGQGRRLLFLS